MIAKLTILITVLCAMFFLNAPLGAEDATESSGVNLQQTVENLGTGTLKFSYQTRDGVRGNGRGMEVSLGSDHHRCYFNGHWEKDDDLVAGPAIALVSIRRGHLVDLDITVGEPRKQRESDLDLGRIDSREVAAFFLQKTPLVSDDIADDLLLAAAIARDAELAAPLLDIVRDRANGTDKRQDALFWVALLASEKALEPIREVIHEKDEDMELREMAVFALAEIDRPETLPLLMDIARNDEVPQLQRAAFFALADHNTPEVIDLFESILLED